MNGYTKADVIRVRQHLIGVATRGETITYTDLANQMQFQWNHKNPNDRRVLGELLGEVSRQEYERCGRPLLTAIVVRKGEKMPGPGFRGFLGFPVSDEFLKTERRRVHEFWAWRE